MYSADVWELAKEDKEGIVAVDLRVFDLKLRGNDYIPKRKEQVKKEQKEKLPIEVVRCEWKYEQLQNLLKVRGAQTCNTAPWHSASPMPRYPLLLQEKSSHDPGGNALISPNFSAQRAMPLGMVSVCRVDGETSKIKNNLLGFRIQCHQMYQIWGF
ncbi:hypothetical protein VitviT2T_006601 [Vitis vinifera]|uniref:Uncharacterized protein n=1 Tax=Vitis vinifera TaxID=29760 RepID=A0ABY9BY62_VITVI|nr:hypothetical protein VitviT2T_006601 [Vitis vinifera]